MATGGTPQAGKVFRIPYEGGRGGVSTYAPNDPRLEREILGERRMAEDRAQEKHDLSMKHEERLQARYDRELQKQDTIESALDKIDKKIGRPATMSWQDNYEELMGDSDIHAARTTKDGRAAIDSAMKEHHDAHQEYINSWSQIANNYGYTGDVMKLPRLPSGEVDWKKTQPVFDQALRQRRQDEMMQAMATRQAAEQAGYAAIPMPDGKPKIVKKAETFGTPVKTSESPTLMQRMGFGSKPAATEQSPATKQSLAEFAQQWEQMSSGDGESNSESIDSGTE